MRASKGPGLALMNSLPLASTLTSAAGIAASVQAPTPDPAAIAAPVERRRVNSSCISSVVSELAPPTSGLGSDFLSWVRSTSGDASTPGCIITAPASVSSDYSRYHSEFQAYLSTIASKAGDIRTDCGFDDLSLTFSQFCTTSLTVLFTSGTEETRTTYLSSVNIPHETIAIGQSVANGTMTIENPTTAPKPTGTSASGSKEYPKTALLLALAFGVVWSIT
ncbi:hypothetical protein JDV02_008834 [Purpureocillium takamizusanense]|uniref:Infection structure specific protein n=1 Tax=Purpureocillium takamizusanense TaxID=2060973 RepID=A0A9Q8QPH9_9HYPO|nr:uncharacterized protein JDV02_008834 [Purpureocillium takamizusanense]UNI22992.1 hypothetical protein JDV02_008834 [Purpureocillium takamizusanense]